MQDKKHATADGSISAVNMPAFENPVRQLLSSVLCLLSSAAHHSTLVTRDSFQLSAFRILSLVTRHSSQLSASSCWFRNFFNAAAGKMID